LRHKENTTAGRW